MRADDYAFLQELQQTLIERLEQVSKPIGTGSVPAEEYINKGHIAATVSQVFDEYKEKLAFLESLPFKVGDTAHWIGKFARHCPVEVHSFKIHEIVQKDGDVYFNSYWRGEIEYSFCLKDVGITAFADIEEAYNAFEKITEQNKSVVDRMYDEWDFVE